MACYMPRMRPDHHSADARAIFGAGWQLVWGRAFCPTYAPAAEERAADGRCPACGDPVRALHLYGARVRAVEGTNAGAVAVACPNGHESWMPEEAARTIRVGGRGYGWSR